MTAKARPEHAPAFAGHTKEELAVAYRDVLVRKAARQIALRPSGQARDQAALMRNHYGLDEPKEPPCAR